jgi:large subunit ribosomal protein L10
MPKAEKVRKVTELAERIRGSEAMFIADYRGLTVAEVTELRRSLREAGTRFTVAKNTLLRLAAGEAGVEGMDDLLQGPTAVAFVAGDPIVAARGLAEALRRYRTLEIRGGYMEGRVMSSEEAQALATIEPREVLLSRLAGALKAEMSRAAYAFQALQSRFLSLLDAYREKLPGEAGAASADEAPPETEGDSGGAAAPEPAPPEGGDEAEPAEAEAAPVASEAAGQEATTSEDEPADAAGEEGKE